MSEILKENRTFKNVYCAQIVIFTTFGGGSAALVKVVEIDMDKVNAMAKKILG